MNALRNTIFHRTELLVGKNILEKIRKTRVTLFGIGGVGSWAAEGLIRGGIGHLTMVDSDVVCPTNINRQLQALISTVGKSKLEILSARLKDINPEAEITLIPKPFTYETRESFSFEKEDYIIDAIDTLQNKALLLECCYKEKKKIFSSMGSACRIDPSKIRIAPLNEVKNCRLSYVLRQKLRKKKVPLTMLCVYSEELPRTPKEKTTCGSPDCLCPKGIIHEWCNTKGQINGSICHIPAIFGFMLSGLVLQYIEKCALENSPKILKNHLAL